MPNILIADDEKEIVKLLRIYLEADDVTVLEANDGAQALALLEDHDVDLALVDIMMPKVDGYGLIKAIRRREKYIPVIVISAKMALSDRVLGIDLGIDMFWSNFDSKTDAFMQANQIIKTVDFSHYVDGTAGKKNSGFDVFGLTAPLVVKGIFDKFVIGGGAFANWNITGSTYCRYRKDNVRAQLDEVKAKVNPFTYGFLATVSYDDFGVYFKYYPKSSKLLPEGSVDLSYMTLGLVIGF